MNTSFAVGQRVRVINAYALGLLCLEGDTGTVVDVNPFFRLPVGVAMDSGGVGSFADGELELLQDQEVPSAPHA